MGSSRQAAELVPIAAAVLGEAGEVVADHGTNQLVLIGPKALVSQALALLEEATRDPEMPFDYDLHERLAELYLRGASSEGPSPELAQAVGQRYGASLEGLDIRYGAP